jgi:DNA polymerase-3 subunit gamma/tau
MDRFIVSARKYRPVTFDSVVGQQHITSTLKNAIRNQQLAQAFLFCGPRGVGKTTCARILAKTINCSARTETQEACGQCDNCKSFSAGTSFSVHELDAASNNSVDDIRNLIDQVRIPPQQGSHKVYIIDEVHMLSQAAFNAFLKTLEEPPSYAIFILATTEKHKILPTILSRCQIFDFNRIKVEDMANHLSSIALQEGIEYEYDGLHIIAQKADGGLRDALSMFDQIASFSNKSITYQSVINNLNILDSEYYFKVVEAIQASDAARVLLMFDEILTHGFDGNHFIGGLASHFRNLLVAKDPKTIQLLESSERIKNQFLTQSSQVNTSLLLSALNIANQTEIAYKNSKNPRLQVELALIKMCHIQSALRLDPSQLPVMEEKKKSEPIVQASQKPVEAPKIAQQTEKKTIENPVDNKGTSVQPENSFQPEIKVQPNTPIPQEKQVQENKPSAPQDGIPEQVEEKPKPKQNNWSSATLGGELSSLNATIFGNGADKSEEDGEKKLVSGTAFDEIHPDQLLAEWHKLADAYKGDNKINIFTLMTSNAPKLLNSTTIELLLDNQIQESILLNERSDIVNSLRKSLNNYALDIVPKINENKKVKVPYTASEKYQALVEKNPLIEQFRQEFNLGLE